MARRKIKAKQGKTAGGSARARRRASRLPEAPTGASTPPVAPASAQASRQASAAPQSTAPQSTASQSAASQSAASQSAALDGSRSTGSVVAHREVPSARRTDPGLSAAPAVADRASEPPRASAPEPPQAEVPAAAEPPQRGLASGTEPNAAPGAEAEAEATEQPAFDGRRTDPELAQLSHNFFSAPPPSPAVDDWVDDYDLPEIDKGRKRAMHATLGILAASVLSIGGYLVYHKMVMPTPVALGGASVYEMPVPVMNTAPPPVRVPAPEEAAKLRAHHPTAMAPAPLPEVAGDEGGTDKAVPDALTPNVDEVDEQMPTTTDEVVAAPPAESEQADDGFEQLLAEGVKLARKGRSKDALRVLEQARGLRPNGGRVLSELAFLHLNRGRNDEAAELAGRAVAVDPTISMAWIVLGAARDAKRDRSGAKAAYEQCAALPIDEYVRECRQLAR